MSNAETTKDLVGQSIREIKRGIDTLADSTKAPLEAESLEVQQNIQHAIDQVKDAVSVALDCLTQCSSVDQLRGYANEAMGKTKLAIALSTRSPELAVAGIVQQVIGDLQKFIGEAKNADEKE
ncbi:CsbD family protein [Methylocystis sp. FS]|uniref:CsbD family protein n=1 Tax=Methylocystis TaxID=133 RepID=UPI0015822AFF|nr:MULTISPECIES: CsbD family protein [Methylocystis]MBG0800046.1 CsbD family protein [Methylocystis sp. H4A]NUJ81975.1 CsbD family protein [Methylocystis silviterrae]